MMITQMTLSPSETMHAALILSSLPPLPSAFLVIVAATASRIQGGSKARGWADPQGMTAVAMVVAVVAAAAAEASHSRGSLWAVPVADRSRSGG